MASKQRRCAQRSTYLGQLLDKSRVSYRVSLFDQDFVQVNHLQAEKKQINM